MGKTKIKTIDDSVKEEKPSKKTGKIAKSSESEASGAVEQPVIASEATPEAGEAKQSPEKEIATPPTAPRDDKKGKTQKPGKAKPRSKKYQEVSKDLDRTKTYPIEEALDMVKKMSYAKFNATIEAHINTTQTGLRGLLQLPYASGRKLTILAFGKGADTAGASIFGTEKTLEDIAKGQINFDLCLTTPEWMPRLAKVAKILGPKGLMPNPKNGTITDDLKKAVESFQSGKTEYETEPKTPIIHLGLGKLNQPTEELAANVKTLLQTLGKGRIKKVSLSPTMGPSVKVDLASL